MGFLLFYIHTWLPRIRNVLSYKVLSHEGLSHFLFAIPVCSNEQKSSTGMNQTEKPFVNTYGFEIVCSALEEKFGDEMTRMRAFFSVPLKISLVMK